MSGKFFCTENIGFVIFIKLQMKMSNEKEKSFCIAKNVESHDCVFLNMIFYLNRNYF